MDLGIGFWAADFDADFAMDFGVDFDMDFCRIFSAPDFCAGFFLCRIFRRRILFSITFAT